MAAKLDHLRVGSGPVGMLVVGGPGTGKSRMLRQLQDIARRRRGGCPTVSLDVSNGQSILKSLADNLLVAMDNPELAQCDDLGQLKEATRLVAELSVNAEESFPVATPSMKTRLTSMGEALQAARLPFVVFIDDVDKVSAIGMKYLVNFISLAQYKVYPLLFVVSGPDEVYVPIAKACSEGERLFSGFKVDRQDQ
jgi:hypothetical protein